MGLLPARRVLACVTDARCIVVHPLVLCATDRIALDSTLQVVQLITPSRGPLFMHLIRHSQVHLRVVYTIATDHITQVRPPHCVTDSVPTCLNRVGLCN
jgi:hypothetical protein